MTSRRAHIRPTRFTPVVSILPLLVLILLPAGCQPDGSEEGDRALKRRLERRAAARPKKASLTLGSIHHFEDITPGEPVATAADGAAIEVDEAYLVVSAIEVHACEPGVDDYESPGGPLLNDLGDRLWPLVGGTARAHVPSSATRLGTPFVDDLLGKPDSARIVGEVAPPLAAYCHIVAVVSPADDDVVNSTPLATSEIVGHSLLVRGRWRPDPESDWRDFTLGSDHARTIQLPALDPRTGKSPLTFADPGASSMLLLDKTLSPSTFAAEPDDPTAGRRIIDRIAETMRIHQF